MQKPSIPQGTRDFGPEIVRKRNYILNTIRSAFELYGFAPLETPAMENLETLLGKYGDEGDKLIFKILNNGLDHPKKQETARQEFEKIIEGKNSSAITERALRYDLTIPFARYVAMNHQQLNFPFRRYQIQPVWRADRPQKGRYREFYQCDADVVGSRSLLNEVEFVSIYKKVLTDLKLKDATVKINSRKILAALAEVCGGSELLVPITVAIDKLDKIGWEKVSEELTARGMIPQQINTISAFLNITGTNYEKLAKATELVGHIPSGAEGINELKEVIELSANDQPEIDFSLARGLNYYTGCIFEVKAPPQVNIGSIGGGGRYDDLTGLFGVSGIAGAGISFGVDRIYDVLEELNLFPDIASSGTRVLFFNLGKDESTIAYAQLQILRSKGISSELYHETAKFDKQFKYAEKKNIPFAVIIGSKEIESGTCIVKNLGNGHQQSIPLANLENTSFI
jgi:histidyl-tRNA synthetase